MFQVSTAEPLGRDHLLLLHYTGFGMNGTNLRFEPDVPLSPGFVLPDPRSSGSSNKATKLGVGIGVGIGGPLLCAAVGLLMWSSARKK